MPRRVARVTFFLLMAGSLWWLSGCNSDGEGSDGGDSSGQSTSGTSGQPSDQGTSGDDVSNPLIRTGPNGRKMFVDIPMEVWIDDPLAVVAQPGTIPGGTPVVDPGTVPNETPSPVPTTTDPPPETGGDEVAWDKVIPMPILDAEVKRIRNELSQIMQSIGSFNSSFQNIPKEIPVQAYTLVAMAQIGERHPGDALWKKNSPALRELGVLVADNATATGRTSYNAALIEFEKIQGIFNGTAPDLAEPPEPMADFGDKAELKPIMYRMSKAYNYLNSNTPTESSLESAKEKITHEVTVMEAILTVIKDPSYFISDDEKYQAIANGTLLHVKGMQDGIANGDFDLFKQNLGAIDAKCQNCHTEFKP